VRMVVETYRRGELVSRTEGTRLLSLDREKKRRAARRSLLEFTKYTKDDYDAGQFHVSLCGVLDQFARGEIPRLIIMAPPRHGKSELVSRRLPAFILGRNPNAAIIAASYSSDLSSRMNRDVQRIIDSPRYRELFPETRLSGKGVNSASGTAALRNNDIFEIVDARGVYRSAGVGGGITGMGADYAIIDDPIKDQKQADSPAYRQTVWDWYCSTLYTRLAKGDAGKVLLTLTRWHEDDLAGRLLDLAKTDPEADQWVVVRYEAIKETADDQAVGDARRPGEALWPSGYDEKRLRKIRASVGARVWNSLYQQRPTATAGAMIKRQWIRYWTELPDHFEELVMSWDMAFKDAEGSDYVVGQVWGRYKADKYLLDELRELLDFPGTLKAFRAFCAKHPKCHVKLVEDKANGPAVIATLTREIPGIIAIEPKGSKLSRLAAVSADYEAGNVWVPHPTIAPWVSEHVNEVVSFPKGAKDDRVDAASQALNRFRNGADHWPKQEEKADAAKPLAPSKKSGDTW
jgi:predicted phage terminase large subunit-like protein